MNYKIKIEGQEIDMPEEIAGDDGALKSALSPYFPGAANAKFMRSETVDGVITVTVVKQAGTKGNGTSDDTLQIRAHLDSSLPGASTDHVLRKLIDAPEGINPVVALDNELEGRLLNQMSVEKLFTLNDQIDEVINDGQDEYSKMESTLRGLREIEPVPSASVVTGF